MNNALGFDQSAELDFLDSIINDDRCERHPDQVLWPDCIKCSPCEWHPHLPDADCPECLADYDAHLEDVEDERRHP